MTRARRDAASRPADPSSASGVTKIIEDASAPPD